MDRQAAYIQALHESYPGLGIETVRVMKLGQFNDVLLVNEDTIFRFPKTQREAARSMTEAALLRSLQQYVTLPIPDPVYQSREAAAPGQAFMGYRLLPGEPLWPKTVQVLSGQGQIQGVAEQLATFLRQLHTIPVEAVGVRLPAFRGGEEWKDLYDRFRDRLFPFMRPDAHRQVTRHFEDFLDDERNWNYAPALIHGDFGPSNILYEASTNTVSGILDFASARWGDPAVDLAALLGPVSYGEPFVERFAAIYPGINALLTRARFYAGTFALQEALYGLEDGDQEAFNNGIAEYL